MDIRYFAFDNLHSMIGLGRRRSEKSIVLSGRSNDAEMKLMLLRSQSGVPITLREIFDDLKQKVITSDERLITDEWVPLSGDVKVYFLSLQNPKCEVRSELCRYTAFSYVFRNKQIEIYDCDNKSVTHKAFADITMLITYSVNKKLEEKKRLFRAAELVDTGYYEVTVECDDIDVYEDGYLEYLCGDIYLPLTKEAVQRGFFVKAGKNEPELRTPHRELIDLRRRG